MENKKYIYDIEGRSIIFGENGDEVMELAENVLTKYIKIGQMAEVGIRDGKVNFVKAIRADGPVRDQENAPQILSKPRSTPTEEPKKYMSIRDEQDAARQELIVRQTCLKVAGRLAEVDKVQVEQIKYYAELFRDWVFNKK